jgi:hypothetical protein
MGKCLLFIVIVLLAVGLPATCDWRSEWDAYCHVHESNDEAPGLWLTVEIRRSIPLSRPNHRDADPHEDDSEENSAFHVYIDHEALAYNTQAGRLTYLVDANEIETVFVRSLFNRDYQGVSIAWWLNSPTSASQITKRTRCAGPGDASVKLTAMPTCCMKPPRWQRIQEQRNGMGHNSTRKSNEARDHQTEEEEGFLADGCWKLIFKQSEDSEPVDYNQWHAWDEKNPYDDIADSDAWGHTMSILDEIERFRSAHDGKFTFAMSWSDLGSHDSLQGVNIWRQTSNPTMSPSVEGFEEIDVRWTSLGFGGL